MKKSRPLRYPAQWKVVVTDDTRSAMDDFAAAVVPSVRTGQDILRMLIELVRKTDPKNFFAMLEELRKFEKKTEQTPAPAERVAVA